jgi:copper(I)-binding protein
MRQGPDVVRLPEEAVGRLCRQRLIEIGVALVLTLAALLFVVWKVFAAGSPGISVAEAWARPTMEESRITTAYMTITNQSGADDVLTGARSDQAEMIQLHQTSMTADGVMQMREIEGGLPIPAGETVKLAPGGTHLMVMGLGQALDAGGELSLTLEFDKAGAMEIAVPVSASAPGASGDAPHAHP